MRYSFSFVVFGLAVCLTNIAEAQSKTTQLAICVNAKGQVVARTKCPRGQTKLNLQTIQDISKGDKGDRGDQGPAGLLNLNSCVAEIKTGNPCSEGSVCTTQLGCGEGSNGSTFDDLMISWAFTSDTYAAYVAETAIIVPEGKKYPRGVSIKTTSEDGFDAHVPSIAIVCCKQ